MHAVLPAVPLLAVLTAMLLLGPPGVLAQEPPETVRADFNGDGRGDLAIGIFSEDLGSIEDAGAVEVLYGSPTGLTSTGSQFWSKESTGIPGDPRAGDKFGTTVATGDFNGDGRSDMAVGVPGEDVGSAADAGAVVIIYGSVTGLAAANSQLWTQNSTGILDTAEASDGFGKALAAGDFDGDGRDDLAIGVPGEDIGANNMGAVNVLYGSPAGLASARNQLWHQDVSGILDSGETNDNFGLVLAVGNFDGNSRADLAVGIPAEDIDGIQDAGVVAVIYGTGDGLAAANNQLWHQNSTDVLDAAEQGDHFGAALAAGDFNDDGRDDLAIGVEDEDVVFTNCGGMNVLYGTGNGLSAADNDFFTQGVNGISEDCRNDDAFGESIAAGDLDGDGRWDVAVGAFAEDIEPQGASGLVHTIYGTIDFGLSGFFDQLWTQDTPDIPDTAGSFEFFGVSVAMDDFNGDGRSDLAIGVMEGFDRLGSVGAVHVLYGNDPFLDVAGNQFWHQNVAGIAGAQEQGDSFGRALANTSRAEVLGGGLSGEWPRFTQRCAKGNRRSGCSIVGAVAITNPGDRTIERTVMRVYLSSDEIFDESDVLIQESTVRKIRAGATHRERVDAKVPSDATGQFVIAVLDATDNVLEIDEGNNFIVSPPIAP